MSDFLGQHWKAILLVLALVQLINALPAPGSGEWSNSLLYKTIFGFLHGLANLPRMFATLFPATPAGKLFLNGNAKPPEAT